MAISKFPAAPDGASIPEPAPVGDWRRLVAEQAELTVAVVELREDLGRMLGVLEGLRETVSVMGRLQNAIGRMAADAIGVTPPPDPRAGRQKDHASVIPDSGRGGRVRRPETGR